MINELLWILLLAMSFTGIILAYRFFGKTGLYVWTAMAIIVANIQVMKTIQIFGFVTALGNIIYGSTFLVTDILCENHDKKDARKAVWIGFFVLIALTVLMQICIAFVPSPEKLSIELSNSLNNIFSLLPRITFASLSAYIISQNFDVWFYNKIKEVTKGRFLWLRNNGSTMVSQLLDNIIFTYIAFVGLFGIFGWNQVFEWPIVISIFVTSYIMKWIVAAIDTPFLYFAKRMKKIVTD